MYQFKIIESREKWISILNSFNKVDCYYSFEYGSMFAKKEEGKLFAAYYEDHDMRVFYPFIKRLIPFSEVELYDIVTPYGYGGPLVNGSSKSFSRFYEIFSSYCQFNNIITELIRFHPIYRNYEMFDSLLDLKLIRRTTGVDLTTSLEGIRNNYTSMNKRNIKKAKFNNLTCFVAENNEDNIKIFIDLYKETMERTNAEKYYYFDENYFYEQVKTTNISETFLLFTKHLNEIIAGVMVLVGNDFSHYHLGASKSKYLHLKPNNFLFDFMIEFCRNKGSKILHLGGGYQEDDGLFKFKTSFTNNNNFKYYLGCKVHSVAQYKKIIEDLNKQFWLDDSYFPIYRGHMENRVIHAYGERGGLWR